MSSRKIVSSPKRIYIDTSSAFIWSLGMWDVGVALKPIKIRYRRKYKTKILIFPESQQIRTGFHAYLEPGENRIPATIIPGSEFYFLESGDIVVSEFRFIVRKLKALFREK